MTLVQPQPGENLLHELLHELRVHQIELEMQNDELRRAQVVIEESRDRYVDLYEFAACRLSDAHPRRHDRRGEAPGASLLGVDRKKLINRRFAGFVTVESRDYWDRHFLGVLQTDERQVANWNSSTETVPASMHKWTACV